MNAETSTPVGVIAEVCAKATKMADRLTGSRENYPLLVAAAVTECLKVYGIDARPYYGKAAWIEIMGDGKPVWAGCWGDHVHIWAATTTGEIIDLNLNVAHKKKDGNGSGISTVLSPPMIWSAETPGFCRYVPEGFAEMELDSDRDRNWIEAVKKAASELPKSAGSEAADRFPDVAIICPGRRMLDDSKGSFKRFDEALAKHGIPSPPGDF